MWSKEQEFFRVMNRKVRYSMVQIRLAQSVVMKIKCEPDLDVMKILNEVQGDHIVKHADDEIQSAENCENCDNRSRIGMEVVGSKIDRMNRVQCDQQMSEDFEEVDRQFQDDLGNVLKERVKTKRK